MNDISCYLITDNGGAHQGAIAQGVASVAGQLRDRGIMDGVPLFARREEAEGYAALLRLRGIPFAFEFHVGFRSELDYVTKKLAAEHSQFAFFGPGAKEPVYRPLGSI